VADVEVINVDAIDENKKQIVAAKVVVSSAQSFPKPEEAVAYHQSVGQPNKETISAEKRVVSDGFSEKPVKKESTDPKEYWKNMSKSSSGQIAPNSQQPPERVAESGGKQEILPMQGIVKTASKLLSQVKDDESSRTSEVVSDVSSGINPNPNMIISGSKVREMVSKMSSTSKTQSAVAPSSGACTSGGGSMSATSALSKSVLAKQEARKARMEETRNLRMAEMREKVGNSTFHSHCTEIAFSDNHFILFRRANRCLR
jgi:hypothetical protein